MNERSLALRPIGHIRTPFRSKYDAPRQPGTSRRKTVGHIILKPGHNFEQALEDLSSMDYIWVLFWSDQSTTWKPKVLPPSSERRKRGVFATRSPHRPNPLGLSLCRLRMIQGRTLTIDNPDLLDGTPILDIKPYIPHAESVPDAKAGWITKANESSDRPYKVTIKRTVLETIRQKDKKEWRSIEGYVRDTLSRDPSPHAYRRIKLLPDGQMRLAVRRWRFRFQLRGRSIIVTESWRE